MQNSTSVRPSAMPGALVTLGGGLLVIGSLLKWVSLSFSVSQLAALSRSASGVSSSPGKITLVCGIVVLGVGLVMLLAASPSVRRPMAIVVLVFGLIGAAVALYNMATKDRQVDDEIRSELQKVTGRAVSDAELTTLKDRLRAAGFNVSLGAGIYVAALGGAIALAGGVVGLASRGSGPTSDGQALPAGSGAGAGFGSSVPAGWGAATPAAPPPPSAPLPPVATPPPPAPPPMPAATDDSPPGEGSGDPGDGPS